MAHFYSTYSERLKQSTVSDTSRRMLRRLRIALLIWMFSFVGTVIWITISS